MSEPFPFQELMKVCMGHLGMSSKEFWNLTPKEANQIVLAMAIKNGGLARAPTRSKLNEMIARFDEVQQSE